MASDPDFEEVKGTASDCEPVLSVDSKATAPKRLTHSLVKKSTRTVRSVRKSTRKKPPKPKRNATGRTKKRPLSNMSAKDISLQDAADYMGAAWTFGKWALSAINAEEKHLYFLLVDAAMSQSNVIYASAIGQGTDYYQRTGNSIRVTNVRLDYSLTVNTTAVNNLTRIIVLRDLMNIGSTISFGDVLQDTSTSRAIMTSPYNVINGDRFEVLYDNVSHQSVGAEDAVIHKRLAFGIDDHILYQGPGNTVASAWQGALFVLAYSADTNTPFLTMSILVDFIDN